MRIHKEPMNFCYRCAQPAQTIALLIEKCNYISNKLGTRKKSKMIYMNENIIESSKKLIKTRLLPLKPQKYYHSIRVADIAKQLSLSENYKDIQSVILAGILHDISPSKNDRKNAYNSAEKSKEWLSKQSYDPKKIRSIYKAIKATSKEKQVRLDTIEAILHDANILDSMGIIGLLRVAYVMGEERDRDSITELIPWFTNYSIELEKSLATSSAKKIARIKKQEIKRLGVNRA